MNPTLVAAFEDHRAGRLAEAVTGYRAVLEVEPDNVDALNLLGVARRAEGGLDDALDCLARAVAVQPSHADAWYNYGNALSAAGDKTKAAEAYRTVATLDPGRPGAFANLGIVLGDLERFEEAADAYRRAIELDPAHVVARHNLGNLLPDLGLAREGAAHLRRVTAAEPDLHEAHYNLALSLLRLGDYATGLRHYERRWRAAGFTASRLHTELPDWTGAPFPGRRLLIHAEQGLGDTLQFVRFLPLARSLGGEITLELPGSLVRLLAGFPGTDRVAAEGEDFSGHDLALPLMSLPYRLGLTLGSIPRTVSYLAADPERVERWRARLGDDGRRLVGVCWRGNPKASVDRGRSLPDPMLLTPLAELADIRLLALHKMSASELIEDGEGGWRVAAAPFVEHPGPDFDDGPDAFLDTAAVMTLADRIVSTDTSIAHLAGALARPTFLMLKDLPDWRWMLEREDSPWYPTLRLVRQRRRGDWVDVVRRVAEAL